MNTLVLTVLEEELYYIIALIVASLNSFGLGFVIGLVICM